MRKIFLVSILFSIYFLKVSVALNVDGKQNNRDGKVFSLFNIVKFENAGCESSSDNYSGGKRNGTCYSSSECGDKGGSSKGSCAAGFGVCCLFVLNDANSKEVSYNNTYIQNIGYPATSTSNDGITYTVKKCNDNICYLRIDFDQFMIGGPINSIECDTTEGCATPIAVATPITDTPASNCLNDKLQITPPSATSFSVPQICGINTGEHIYIPMGSSATDSASLAFTFQNDLSRQYDMKLTQYECGDPLAPPEGCLQYFTGTSGKIMTFNFQDTKTTHLGQQNYQICMRREEGYCCNKYTVCDETVSTQMNSFSLFPDTGNAYSADNAAALAPSSCSQDYITIQGGQDTCSSTGSGGFRQEKFCGSRLSIIGNLTPANAKANLPVCSCTSPFIVGIVTDNTSDDVAETATEFDWSRGVCLDYRQIPC